MPSNEMRKQSPSTRAKRRIQKKEQRKEIRQAKQEKKDVAKHVDKPERPKKLRKRLIPIWLRVIIVVLLCFVSLIAGLVFGYGVIGEGNPSDALDKSTWQHIIDIVTKQE